MNSLSISRNFIKFIQALLISGSFGLILSFALIKQIYSYQSVVAALFLLPVLVLFLIKFPEKTLLSLFVILISFNPGIPLRYGQDSGLLFYGSDLIMIFIVCYLLIKRSSLDRKSTLSKIGLLKLGLPLILWVLAGLISFLPAINKDVATVEFIRMLRILIIFFVAYCFINKVEDIKHISRFLIYAFLIQVILILFEMVLKHPLFRLPGMVRELDVVAGGLVRPGGTMGHSSNFAKFAAFSLPIVMSYFMITRNKFAKIFLFGVLLLGLIALVQTISRIGIFCAFLAIIIMLIKIFTFVKKDRIGVGIVITVLFICSVVLFVVVGGDRLSKRMQDDSGSAASRPVMFHVANSVIKSNFFLGVGISNYTLVAPKYDDTPGRISVSFPHPVHNIFLLYLAEMGILGLLSFLAFLYGTIKCTFDLYNKDINNPNALLFYAIGIGIIFTWMQGLVDWGFRSSVVHWAYLALFAGALSSIKYKLER